MTSGHGASLMQRCMSPVLALSGHRGRAQQCSLLGVKRTWWLTARMSAFDPKRTCRMSPNDPIQTSGKDEARRIPANVAKLPDYPEIKF
jgi:hypothetical protein